MDRWGHQPRARAKIEAAYRAGRRAILSVIPTGGGKTYLFNSIARGGISKGFRWAVYVHRDELIQQTVESMEALGLQPGVYAAGYPHSDSTLLVCSTQTAVARGVFPRADGVVLDEAHHFCGSEKWSAIPAHYKAAGALLLGFTATPERSDGAAMGNVFDEMIVVCQPRELIASGVLVRARVIHPMRASAALAMHPIEFHRTYGAGRRFIVFAASVKHAKDLAHEFSAAGFPTACVEGSMGDDDRGKAIASFRSGDLVGMTNYAVLTEGFNVREVAEVITCRRFSSPGTMMQALGRGMRSAPGKVDLIAGDLMGWSLDPNIGLPDEDREFSLQGRAIRVAAAAEAIRQCRQCGMVFRASEFEDATCPNCGFRTRGRPDPRIRRQAMTEAAARESGDSRLQYLQRCINSCLLDGKKLGQAKILYMVKYRTPYSRGWPDAGLLARAGYEQAEALRKEIDLYNKAHGLTLSVVAEGLPGEGARRPWVSTLDLVALLREALVRGKAEGVLAGRSVAIEMVDAGASEKKGAA